MTKRRPRLRVTEFPQIVEGLRRQAERNAADHVPGEDGWWPDLAAVLGREEDIALWWVAEPMSRLAHSYAPELPPWDFAAVRPSAAGVLVWEGSSGIEISWMEVDTPVRATVQGIFWGVAQMRAVIVLLIRSADVPFETHGVLSFGPSIFEAKEGADRPLWQMFGTTLILAQTPTVVTRHQRPAPRAGGMRIERPSLPLTVTQVVLREAIRHTDPGTAEETEGKKWTLKNRHLVRGHWRQQACGPNREWRKPTFVPPYIKGPADGELRLTREVHVWRR